MSIDCNEKNETQENFNRESILAYVRWYVAKSIDDIIFTQKRVWKDGKIFKVYKIRTMEHWSDHKNLELAVKWNKPDNDPRVLLYRKWLRKTWIDEIPQIINILKGDMVFFWARPLSIECYEALSKSEKTRRDANVPGVFWWYAFMWKTKREYSIRNYQNIYLRLRNIKEKKSKMSLWIFHTYILFWNIVSILNGNNR
jgi:lipopolysaccharide/colanic/teichoic acid biosynthesis glycosyltransferase